MKLALIKYVAIFNLILGLTLLVSGPIGNFAPVRSLENFFYKAILSVKGSLTWEKLGNTRVSRIKLIEEKEGKQEIKAVHWEATSYEESPPPKIAIVEAGEDPGHLFDGNPPLPLDYAVITFFIRTANKYNLMVTAPMIWNSPSFAESELENSTRGALLTELEKFDNLFQGVVLSPSARRNPLPDFLSDTALEPSQIKGDISQLPSAGKLVEAPLSPSKSSVILSPMQIETEPLIWDADGEQRVSLFVRWGDQVLPTLPLVTALNMLNLSISDIRLNLGKEVKLGKKKILPIDNVGSIAVKPVPGKNIRRTSALSVISATGKEEDIKDPEFSTFLASAQLTVLGEGNTPLAQLQPGNNAPAWDFSQTLDISAAGVGAILSAPLADITVTLSRMGHIGQIIILIDLLILATWSMTFSPRKRDLFFAGFLLLLLATGVFSCLWLDLWLPLVPPVTALALAFLAAFIFNPRKSIIEGDPVDIVVEEEELVPIPPPLTQKEKISPKKEKQVSLSRKAQTDSPAKMPPENPPHKLKADKKGRSRKKQG